MTLAVAIRIPIGFLARLPSLPNGVPLSTPGVVLMTDSRYSGASGLTYSDSGAKLWHLGNRIAGAFAGNVELAEKGMSATKRRLDDIEVLSFSSMAEAVRDGFRTAVPRDRRSSPTDRVEAIVATVSLSGEVGIIVSSSADDFEPRWVKNAWAGDEQVMRDFLELLPQAIPPDLESLPAGFSMSGDITDFEVRLGAVMATTIERTTSRTVGGGVQMVGITPTEYRVKEGEQGMGGLPPNLSVVTTGPNDVQGLTGRDNRRKDFDRPGAAAALISSGEFDI